MVTNRLAWRLLLLQVLLLLVGTQMPGVWRASIEHSLHSPWGLSSWAHLFLFAGMAWITAGALAWPWHRLILLALGLALLTEGMQFFALDRHPRWLDVGIDLAGAGLGMLVARLSAGRRCEDGNKPARPS
jgi:hypothetical protein